METPFVRSHSAARTRRQSVRTQIISLLGPATVTAGLIWAILQPYRVTLLHPVGQSFWWLVVEPPLLVAGVGVVFALLVARPLIADLERGSTEPGSTDSRGAVRSPGPPGRSPPGLRPEHTPFRPPVRPVRFGTRTARTGLGPPDLFTSRPDDPVERPAGHGHRRIQAESDAAAR